MLHGVPAARRPRGATLFCKGSPGTGAVASLRTELSPELPAPCRGPYSLHPRLLTLPSECGSGRVGSARGRGVAFVNNSGYSVRVALTSPHIAWLQKRMCVTCEVCSLVRVLICLNVLLMICNYCCG